MNRFAYNQLTDWRNSENNSVLIIGGVPGVGKRDMALKFAKESFDDFTFIDLQTNTDSIDKYLNHTTENSLIVLDNILGDKIKLIKIVELSKNYINYKFIVIDSFAKESRGSDLSVAVSYLVLYPLGFEEFLFNVNRDIFNELATLKGVETISKKLHENLINIFIDYLVVGGMPKVVEKYISNGLDFTEIRNEQKIIIDNILNKLAYYYKTTEYKNLKKILELIYPTLVRDNRKFKLADISLSKRFSSFSRYFRILENLNLIYISKLVRGHESKIDDKSLILYFFDTGLLGLLGNVPEQQYRIDFLLSNPITLALCANFSAGEIHSTKNIKLNFWNNNMSKIEFLLRNDQAVMPIELKNDSSGKLKSLESYHRIYNNKNLTRINLDLPSIKGDIKTFPIYLIKSLARKFLSLN